ncbi:MAG: hypothetical protein H0W02_22635, partial [Ktedonobacteraceae bacterium]|nr:hypothetical protein [Ktedonobacteraceae bacterium]
MLCLRLFPHLTHRSLISLGGCVCLLAGLLLTGCDSASTVVSRATSTATTASTVSSPAMSTVTTSLTPVTAPLAAPPQNCALRPPPQTQHLDHLGENTNVRLVGGGPFWVYGAYYPSVLHLAQYGSQQWPMTKIVVEVGPNYNQPVTLRLREMQTGALAWWTDGQVPPRAATRILILNPQTDTQDVGSVAGVPDVPHGSPGPGWKEWGVFPMFSVAGCYALEVSWSGGSWQSSFAVG